MPTVSTRRHAPSSLFTCYLSEIDAAPLLSAEEELAVAHRVRTGDADARDRLVRANLRLVVALARRYAGQGLPLEDLVAEGNLGLVRAAEGFDPEAGTRFATYAAFWVKQSIRRALSATGRVVRVPHYAGGLLAKWRRAAAELQDELGRTPADFEVAERLSLTRRQVRVVKEAMRAAAAAQSADGEDGPGLPDGRAAGPGDRLELSEDVGLALGALGRLDDREAVVLRLRFGLGGEDPRTLQEVGDAIGCTRERARQIEREALAKLREVVAA